MPKISLITLGCAKNLVDSEVMLGDLFLKGYEFTEEPEQADILIINTCGFIRPAREEAHQYLDWAVNWRKKSTARQLVVTGCYVERFGDFLKTKYPQVDIWTGVTDFDRISQLIEKNKINPRYQTFLLNHQTPRVLTTGPNWAYVKISEGCSHKCTFCSIPLIKGSYRSRSINSIVQEVKNLASMGRKEINLISHDTTYFGRDRKLKNGLPKLLRQLLLIKGINWIRLLYCYPEEITDELLELMTEEKMCAYFDLPFQHSAESVLKKMGRAMNGQKALKLINKIRRSVPGAVIRTSLIVGFPTETRKEYEDLKNFVKAAEFEHLGVFAYSLEPGSQAEAFGDPIPAIEKQKRIKEIMEIQKNISQRIYRRYLGKNLEVITEGFDRVKMKALIARARFQAPEVDGLVLIKNWPESFLKSLPPLIKVKITKTLTYDLVGKVFLEN
ncbi:MAG: 30S ribosomal protein S12 methylthiotransferase RimO [Candidatus Aminicenantes bacterium]|jgi:ribosomal protein S12 methylthiotransferase|nr:30S ribosomal protein S12 methylthiotransferase RimO [Candidatus Aminicenantes bacterium]